MSNNAYGRAIVVGSQRRMSSEIGSVLKPHFHSVQFLPDLRTAMSRTEGEPVRLILLLEPDERLLEVAQTLRRAFPSAKLLGLIDAFHPEQEVVLRTAGVIFLGSWERFSRNSQSILSKALKIDCDGQTGNGLKAFQIDSQAGKNVK